MTDKEAKDLLDSCVLKLSEHFASVQILASRLEPNGGTKGTYSGSGDWYARRGLCQEFVECDQADTIAKAVNRNQPPIEGDEWKK